MRAQRAVTGRTDGLQSTASRRPAAAAPDSRRTRTRGTPDSTVRPRNNVSVLYTTTTLVEGALLLNDRFVERMGRPQRGAVRLKNMAPVSSALPCDSMALPKGAIIRPWAATLGAETYHAVPVSASSLLARLSVPRGANPYVRRGREPGASRARSARQKNLPRCLPRGDAEGARGCARGSLSARDLENASRVWLPTNGGRRAGCGRLETIL